MYLSKVDGGKLHDKTHWNRENVTFKLHRAYYKSRGYRDGKIDEYSLSTQHVKQ